MKKYILSIDTSCDETAAAITLDTKVIASKVWSQASLHAKFGGVYPSLAKRKHEERIDFVIKQTLKKAKLEIKDISAIAVTVGPGLAPALEVGIQKAKELSLAFKKPLFAVNHVEAHLLSPLIGKSFEEIKQHFPALGLVVSGGNTQLIFAKKPGKYKIIAETIDDALGEALDKGARALGLGYPGGPVLEKIAEEFKVNKNLKNPLPLPFVGQEKLRKFSYSGLKTALVRLIEKIKKEKGMLKKEDIISLAYFYQERAFNHIERMVLFVLKNQKEKPKSFLVGGGVIANNNLRKKLRKIAKSNNLKLIFPPHKKYCGDNAAMIGVALAINLKERSAKNVNPQKIDRIPRLKLTESKIY